MQDKHATNASTIHRLSELDFRDETLAPLAVPEVGKLTKHMRTLDFMRTLDLIYIHSGSEIHWNSGPTSGT